MQVFTSPTLPNTLGECENNGVQFGAFTKSSPHGRYVRDDANRMVKYVGYEIRTRGHVGAVDDESSDFTLDQLRVE